MADLATPTALASVPEDSATASTSTSGIPPAAKAAAELAVRTAIAESVPLEDGEITESSSKNGIGSGNAGDSNGMRTVFTDPANFNVVHPLYSKW